MRHFKIIFVILVLLIGASLIWLFNCRSRPFVADPEREIRYKDGYIIECPIKYIPKINKLTFRQLDSLLSRFGEQFDITFSYEEYLDSLTDYQDEAIQALRKMDSVYKVTECYWTLNESVPDFLHIRHPQVYALKLNDNDDAVPFCGSVYDVCIYDAYDYNFE